MSGRKEERSNLPRFDTKLQDVCQEHRCADCAALYERHSREVWAMVYARWMNADTATDIMQETFLRLLKQLENGEAILNPRAWLLRVGHNLAEDYGKNSFVKRNRGAKTLETLRSREGVPLEVMDRKERLETVREAVAILPRDQRLLYKLHFELGLTVRQISSRIGKSRSNVGRALQSVYARLQPHVEHLLRDG